MFFFILPKNKLHFVKYIAGLLNMSHFFGDVEYEPYFTYSALLFIQRFVSLISEIIDIIDKRNKRFNWRGKPDWAHVPENRTTH